MWTSLGGHLTVAWKRQERNGKSVKTAKRKMQTFKLKAKDSLNSFRVTSFAFHFFSDLIFFAFVLLQYIRIFFSLRHSLETLIFIFFWQFSRNQKSFSFASSFAGFFVCCFLNSFSIFNSVCQRNKFLFQSKKNAKILSTFFAYSNFFNFGVNGSVRFNQKINGIKNTGEFYFFGWLFAHFSSVGRNIFVCVFIRFPQRISNFLSFRSSSAFFFSSEMYFCTF